MFKLDNVTCQGHFCSVAANGANVKAQSLQSSVPFLITAHQQSLVGPSPRSQWVLRSVIMCQLWYEAGKTENCASPQQ